MSAIGQKTRLRFLLSTPLMYGASESGVEFDAKLPRYIRITDIRPDGTLDPDKAVSLPRNTALPYLLTDRDILLARSGATVGKAFLYRSDGDEACFAGYLIRARCDQRRMLAEYLAYYLQSAGYWDFINSSALQATIQNVSAELYKEILVTHPSVEQQKKVVAYLDEQTRKIDQLMNMRRRQMALLKEQRAAVIQEAVTRGLNPNVPMKDSGLPWLGEIPKHWVLMPLRRRLREHRQGYYTTEPYQEKGVRLLRITDLRDSGRVDFSDSPFVENRSDIIPFFLREFDFVFARTGGAGLFGMIETVDEPVAYASYLIRFRFDEAASPQFLRYFFLSRSFQETLKQNIHGGVNQNVHAEDIKNLLLTLPPAVEQSEIVSFLNGEGSKFDALHAAYTRQLTLLTEYRTALIHECVTGQRSVPETVTA